MARVATGTTVPPAPGPVPGTCSARVCTGHGAEHQGPGAGAQQGGRQHQCEQFGCLFLFCLCCEMPSECVGGLMLCGCRLGRRCNVNKRLIATCRSQASLPVYRRRQHQRPMLVQSPFRSLGEEVEQERGLPATQRGHTNYHVSLPLCFFPMGQSCVSP